MSLMGPWVRSAHAAKLLQALADGQDLLQGYLGQRSRGYTMAKAREVVG